MDNAKNESITGIVFDLKRFALNDGPGIRTTVFLKGCPLKCLWCHNPESICLLSQIAFFKERCRFCGACAASCPHGCHVVSAGVHQYEREFCENCGACVSACKFAALDVAGKRFSVDQILEMVLRDNDFYRNSGGGVTLSGGEPLLQFDFCFELLRAFRENSLHAALDTCGAKAFDELAKVLPYVNLLLFDIKETDPLKHMEFTGYALESILENLKLLETSGVDIWLRCPIIPGFNDREEHLRKIAELAQKNRAIKRITLHPYHDLGLAKYKRFGIQSALSNIVYDKKIIQHWLETVKQATNKQVDLV